MVIEVVNGGYSCTVIPIHMYRYSLWWC